jgi:hypothetical protein
MSTEPPDVIVWELVFDEVDDQPPLALPPILSTSPIPKLVDAVTLMLLSTSLETETSDPIELSAEYSTEEDFPHFAVVVDVHPGGA